MSNANQDSLFLLIQSLSKSEKRNFKLFANRLKTTPDTKFLILFDLIDHQSVYDEQAILQKAPQIKQTQISNIKAHLYRQILASLRIGQTKDIEIETREHLDYATILYNRCLYDSARKELEKAKSMAKENQLFFLLAEIMQFEKRIVHTATSTTEKTDKLADECLQNQNITSTISDFSSATTKLYTLHKNFGFVRDYNSLAQTDNIAIAQLPKFDEQKMTFAEKTEVYNTLTWYFMFIHNYENGNYYAQKLISLFDSNPQFICTKTEQYIKAISQLLYSQSKLNLIDQYSKTLTRFTNLQHLNIATNSNLDLLLFRYESTAKINYCFLNGKYTENQHIIDPIAQGIEQRINHFDVNQTITFYYKFACINFGADNFRKSIFWLNKIINLKDDGQRTDIHSFARLLNLLAHYELKNSDQLPNYTRQAERYFARYNTNEPFFYHILSLIRQITNLSPWQMRQSFTQLLHNLLPLEKQPGQKRYFRYFDIISWLESKINGRSFEQTVREKL